MYEYLVTYYNNGLVRSSFEMFTSPEAAERYWGSNEEVRCVESVETVTEED